MAITTYMHEYWSLYCNWPLYCLVYETGSIYQTRLSFTETCPIEALPPYNKAEIETIDGDVHFLLDGFKELLNGRFTQVYIQHVFPFFHWAYCSVHPIYLLGRQWQAWAMRVSLELLWQILRDYSMHIEEYCCE